MIISAKFLIVLAFIAGLMVIFGASGLTVGITITAIFLVVQAIGYAIGFIMEAALRAMFQAVVQTPDEEEGQPA